MRIKFLKNVSYVQNKAEDSREHKEGDVFDGSEDYCKRWLRRQVAVEVPAEKKSGGSGKHEDKQPAIAATVATTETK